MHEAKLAKMEAEMKMVFQQKVQEKEAKLKQSEEELYARHREMKEALEKQRLDLEDKKRRIESGRPLTPEKQSVCCTLFLSCDTCLRLVSLIDWPEEELPPWMRVLCGVSCRVFGSTCSVSVLPYLVPLILSDHLHCIPYISGFYDAFVVSNPLVVSSMALAHTPYSWIPLCLITLVRSTVCSLPTKIFGPVASPHAFLMTYPILRRSQWLN